MAERSGFSCAGKCTVKSGRGFPEILDRQIYDGIIEVPSDEGLSVLYLDRSLFLLPGLSFSPWLSIYWWIVSTGAIFHNQNQIKTLNENYYLNSLCTLTPRPPKTQEHIVLFSIIIYFLYQNKCFCDFLWIFMHLSRYARMCNSSHHL